MGSSLSYPFHLSDILPFLLSADDIEVQTEAAGTSVSHQGDGQPAPRVRSGRWAAAFS